MKNSDSDNMMPVVYGSKKPVSDKANLDETEGELFSSLVCGSLLMIQICQRIWNFHA